MNKQAVLSGPRIPFESRKVTGSATYKQSKTVLLVLSLRVSSIIQTWKQRVSLFNLFKQEKYQPTNIFLFSLTFLPQNYRLLLQTYCYVIFAQWDTMKQLV